MFGSGVYEIFMDFLDHFYEPPFPIRVAGEGASQPEGEARLRTQEIRSEQAAVRPPRGLAVLISILILHASTALGQSVGEKDIRDTEAGSADGYATQEKDSAPQKANVELLQELERMRARIEQLEAELLRRKVAVSRHALEPFQAGLGRPLQ